MRIDMTIYGMRYKFKEDNDYGSYVFFAATEKECEDEFIADKESGEYDDLVSCEIERIDENYILEVLTESI